MKPVSPGVRRRWWLAMGLVLAFVVFMPLRVVLGIAGLGEQGLTARMVTGTIWRGGLVDARFGDLALGDIRTGVSPLHLLVGQLRLGIRGAAPHGTAPLSGAVVAGLSGIGMADMSGDVSTGQIFAPLPISTLTLTGVTVRFRGGACDAASGRVAAALSGGVDGVPGLILPRMVSGQVRCDGARLVLPLASQSGTEAITLRIGGDGSYRAELALQPEDPAIAERLRLAGFVPGPRGYQLLVNGRF